MKKVFRMALAIGIAALPAFGAGTAMPWDGGLGKLASNIAGPTALSMVILGAAGTFLPMIFHGEIPHSMQRLAHIALAGGFLLGIPTAVSYLGITGALV